MNQNDKDFRGTVKIEDTPTPRPDWKEEENKKIWHSTFVVGEGMTAQIKNEDGNWKLILEGERTKNIVDITNLFDSHAASLLTRQKERMVEVVMELPPYRKVNNHDRLVYEEALSDTIQAIKDLPD